MTTTGRKRIIAFDPGHETGWARGVIEDGALTDVHHGWAPWKALSLAFHRTMTDDPYDIVVYESWLLRASAAKALLGSDMQPSQGIGAIRLCCWLAQEGGHPVEIVVQHPKHKTPADALIKYHGLTLPSSEVEHNRDALRHLYYYCFTNDIEVSLERIGVGATSAPAVRPDGAGAAE